MPSLFNKDQIFWYLWILQEMANMMQAKFLQNGHSGCHHRQRNGQRCREKATKFDEICAIFMIKHLKFCLFRGKFVKQLEILSGHQEYITIKEKKRFVVYF